MRRRKGLAGLVAGVGVCLLAVIVFGATTGVKVKHSAQAYVSIAEAERHERVESEGSTFGHPVVASNSTPASPVSAPTPSGFFDGIVAGYTTWDFQHYSSTRTIQSRLVSYSYIKRHVQVTWTCLKTHEVGDPSRQVNFGDYSWRTSGQPGWAVIGDDFGGITITPAGNRGGYSALDMASAGTPTISWESDIENAQAYGIFTRMSLLGWVNTLSELLNRLPDQEDIQVRVVVGHGATNDVYHLAGRDSRPGLTEPASLVYWRYLTPNSIWQGPVLMDSSLVISHQVFAAGDRVVLAFAKPREYGLNRNQYNNDLVYYESTSEGADWIANGGPGITWENGGGFNVTDYVDADPHRCFVDITGGFDSEGRLHLVYTNPAYDWATGTVSLGPCELLHWSEGTPGSNEHAVVSGGTPGGFVGGQDQYFHPVASAMWQCAGSPGVWCRNISRPSLAFGDGRSVCNGQANLDYLYLVYSQFGSSHPADSADASAAGYQNGNLWVSISPDHGLTWAPQRCLTTVDGRVGSTPTRSPGCDVALGDTCRSEHWSSVASMVTDTLHAFYIGDMDAGSVVFGEGNWAVDEAVYLPIFGGGNPNPLCTQFCDCRVWGDINDDGRVNPSDIVMVVNHVYKAVPFPPEPPPGWIYPWERGDVNCSGGLPDPVDMVVFINFVYKSKPWVLVNCVDADGDPSTNNDIGCP